jgi:hypothetical protein
MKGRTLGAGGGAWDLCILIGLGSVENLIELFLSSLQVPVKRKLIEELEKYSIVKWDAGKRADVTLVDSGLVCRVFLEFYRAQKLAKFAKVKHACRSYRDLEKEDQQQTAMAKKRTLSALETILKTMG